MSTMPANDGGIVRLTVLAFADEVQCLNRHPACRYSMYARYELQAPIGPPIGDAPLPPTRDLFPHEMVLTARGYALLRQHMGRDKNVRRLRLTESEAFCVILSEWASIFGAPLDDRDSYYAAPRICHLALYKRHLAILNRDKRETTRLLRAHNKIRAEHVAHRKMEEEISSAVDKMFAANRHLYDLPDYVPE